MTNKSTAKEINLFFVNVQSPPPERALKLGEELAAQKSTILVLSELSSAEGSRLLLERMRFSGYSVHWTTPPQRDYAVAVLIKGIPHRHLSWSADYGVSRATFVRCKINDFDFIIGGLYFPSFSIEKLERRREFSIALEGLLQHATRDQNRCVIFGGDINEIPPWHVPKIDTYEKEGYPLHSMLQRIGLSDLARKFLPPRSYSWFDWEGNGQLLDGAFITRQHGNLVKEYKLDFTLRAAKLTDHSALSMKISTPA